MRRALLVALLAAAPAVAAAADAPPKSDGVRYLYLVRHGHYDRDDNADDHTANGLSALGHEQARLLGARLLSLPVRPDRIVTSDFRRARETAGELATILYVEPRVEPLIHECTPASADSDRADPEVVECEADLAAAWIKYARPSPEKDTHDVLVCHGNVIRWFTAKALGADTRRWRAMDSANASLTVIAVRPDGTTRLVMFSDVGHLPVSKQTWSGKGAGWGAPVGR